MLPNADLQKFESNLRRRSGMLMSFQFTSRTFTNYVQAKQIWIHRLSKNELK